MRHRRWNQYKLQLSRFRDDCRELPVEAVDWPKDIDTAIFEGALKDFALAKLLCEGRTRFPLIAEQLAHVLLPCGFTLEQAWAMTWQEVRIPLCLETGKPGIMYAELGIGEPVGTESILLQDDLEHEMRRALQCALTLAHKQTGKRYALWLRDAGGSFRKGPSLGLPVYLACVLPKEELRTVLATGDIDAEGRLQCVGGIREKGLLIHNKDINVDFDFTCFLFPTGSGDPEQGCFPVDSTEQAVDFVRCKIDSPSLWEDIRHVDRDPAYFWQAIRHDMTSQNAKIFLERAIAYGIFSKTALFTSEELERLCDFFNQYDLLDDVRRSFSPEQAAKYPPSLGLYRIAHVFRRKASRRGDSAFEQWNTIIDRCSEFSSFEWLEEKYENVERMVGSLHNAYRFEAEEKVASLHADLDACASSPLVKGKKSQLIFGKCWGFLGQHAAFCGDPVEAIKYFQRSFETFSESDVENRSFTCTNLAYAAWDAGDAIAANSSVREAEKIFDNDEDIARRKEKYLLALLARESFETGELSPKIEEKFSSLFDEFAEYAKMENAPKKTRGGRSFAHPWQLFFFNRGRMLAQGVDRQRCLWLSYRICTNEAGDEIVPRYPIDSEKAILDTTQITLLPMALLPLSYLPEDEIVLSRVRTILRRVSEACDKDKLYRPHFADLLQAADASSALHAVRCNTKKYFPFNYR